MPKYNLYSVSTLAYLLKAAVVVMVIKISLKLFSHPTFKKYYDQFSKPNHSEKTSNESLLKASWAIRAISARWPWKATCLPQALTFKYFFKNDPTLQLKIGVNTTLGFQAHAWVEKEGNILIGDTPETFMPLWEWQS